MIWQGNGTVFICCSLWMMQETCRMLKQYDGHAFAGVKYRLVWWDLCCRLCWCFVLFCFDISLSTQVTFAKSGLPAWWQIREMTWMKYQKVIWYSSSTWLTSSASSRHAGFLRVEWWVDQHSDELLYKHNSPIHEITHASVMNMDEEHLAYSRNIFNQNKKIYILFFL